MHTEAMCWVFDDVVDNIRDNLRRRRNAGTSAAVHHRRHFRVPESMDESVDVNQAPTLAVAALKLLKWHAVAETTAVSNKHSRGPSRSKISRRGFDRSATLTCYQSSFTQR